MKIWAVKCGNQCMGEDLDEMTSNLDGNSPADPLIIPDEVWDKLKLGDKPVYVSVSIKKVRQCAKHDWWDYQAVNDKYYRVCQVCGKNIEDRRKKNEH